jgi:hypothetical protein
VQRREVGVEELEAELSGSRLVAERRRSGEGESECCDPHAVLGSRTGTVVGGAQRVDTSTQRHQVAPAAQPLEVVDGVTTEAAGLLGGEDASLRPGLS